MTESDPMLTCLRPASILQRSTRQARGLGTRYGYANRYEFACAWPLAHAACAISAVAHRGCDRQRTPQLFAVQRFRQSVGRRACRAWGRPRGSRRDHPSKLARTACDLLGLREAWRRRGAFVATPPGRGLHIVAE